MKPSSRSIVILVVAEQVSHFHVFGLVLLLGLLSFFFLGLSSLRSSSSGGGGGRSRPNIG